MQQRSIARHCNMLNKEVNIQSKNNRVEINICTILVGLLEIVLGYIGDEWNVEQVRNSIA